MSAQPDGSPRLPDEPLPAESVPESGTFWSVQLPEQPPLPYNPFPTLDVYRLDENTFIIDDRLVDYDLWRKEQEALRELEAAALGISVDELLGRSVCRSSAVSGDGTTPHLTNLVATQAVGLTVTASFDIAGGTKNVPYDIVCRTNLTDAKWAWIGLGYTSNRYTFTNQSADMSFYALAQPEQTMTVGWGNSEAGQCEVPQGLSNAVAVVGGGGQSLALLADGNAVAWGQNAYGQGSIPTNIAGVAMLAAGWYHSVALLTNGTVVAWGYNNPLLGYNLTNVPPDLTNATVISAQALHTLALRDDGTVAAWGYDQSGETSVPAGLSNVVAIAAGYQHSLAVTADGTVAAWGGNGSGQCDVPAGLSNVWDVAAGVAHSLALRKDGTVVAWGGNGYGETEVPAGLSNVVAIAACGDPLNANRHSLALRNDGTVAAWGNGQVLDEVEGLNHVIALGAGADHAVAVRTGPPTPVITLVPQDQYQVAGETTTFESLGRGVYGVGYQWQFEGVNIAGATNASLTLPDVQAQDEGDYRVIASNEAGSIASPEAHLYLVTPPVILAQSQPTNFVMYYQADRPLSVTASAPGQNDGFPLSYQWQFNATNIADATNSIYSLYAHENAAGTYEVTVANAAGSASTSWTVALDFNTLAYHLATNTAAYASGHTGSDADKREVSGWAHAHYTATNLHLLTNAVWSTNFWLRDVQGLSATCVGFSNGVGGQGLMTMVSPRHYLCSTHMHPENYLAAFLDTNNVIHWRTTLERVDVGSDTSVGILNEDLPAPVGFLPVVPDNLLDYLPTNDQSYVQGLAMDQELKVFGQPMTFSRPGYVNWAIVVSVPYGLGTNWNEVIVGGDSSAPGRLLVGAQLVVATHNWGPDVGPDYASAWDALNAQMHHLSTNNNVGTDYQLTPYLLTNWPHMH